MMLQHMYQMYIKSGGHSWKLTNNPDKPFGRKGKDEYDVLKCDDCGVTGRVLPNGSTVYIGFQYEHSIVMDCPGFVEKPLTRQPKLIRNGKCKLTRNNKPKLLRRK